MIEALLTALLLIAHPAGATRACIDAHRADIVARVGAAHAAHGVPPGVLLVVAYLESHFGCHPRSGGSWGSPIDRNHRHTAGGAGPTARDLATSRRIFPTWLEALSRYRCGRRRCPLPMAGNGYSPGFAVGLVERVHARAGYAPPADLRPAPRGARP